MYPTAPWERVHAEFEGQHYLIMIDAFSKWLEVHEMGISTMASRTIEVMRRVFSFHGIPRRLVTDNGPQFRSVEFQEFMKGNGVKHQLTPPYHPSSNGQAERAVQIFKRSMEARPKDVLFDIKYLYYCCSIGQLQIPQQEKRHPNC